MAFFGNLEGTLKTLFSIGKANKISIENDAGDMKLTPSTGKDVIVDSLTASEIVSTDASKKLQSLPVETYPSLTELSYVKGLTSAAQTQLNGKNSLHGVVARPVGASNPLPTNLTTTTFTLGATANPISYYYQGTLVEVSADKTATLGEGAGFYYVYFNAATGNILATKASPGFVGSSNVIIATVNWNGTDYGLVQDERHSYDRNKPWHEWAHNTIGCRYRSGLTLTHNSGTGVAATFATTAGELDDEDIQFTINASSAFPTANAGRLLWQTGASSYTFNKTLSTVPGYLGANARPNYVKSSDYSLVQMSNAVNRYINIFAYATTDLTGPIYFVTESISDALAATNGYTSLANARAAKFPNLSGFGLSPEMKPIYRLIWRADGELQAINTILDDYRTVTSLPLAAGTVSTIASAVSYNPYGSISAANVQNAINELSDEKLDIAGGTLGDAAQIELTPTLSADHTGTGTIISATVDANTYGIASALHLDTDGNYIEADADVIATMPCCALALETGTGTKKILLRGIMRDDTWDWTPGVPIYVSNTVGTLTATHPSTSGNQVQIVGMALTAVSIFFNPSFNMVEIV